MWVECCLRVGLLVSDNLVCRAFFFFLFFFFFFLFFFFFFFFFLPVGGSSCYSVRFIASAAFRSFSRVMSHLPGVETECSRVSPSHLCRHTSTTARFASPPQGRVREVSGDPERLLIRPRDRGQAPGQLSPRHHHGVSDRRPLPTLVPLQGRVTETPLVVVACCCLPACRTGIVGMFWYSYIPYRTVPVFGSSQGGVHRQ